MEVNFIKNLFSVIICLFLALFFYNNLYTDEEKAAITQLRPLVNDLLVRDYQKKDGYLLRFLRASNFNINEAVQKLKRYLQYRKENNIDNILSFDSEAHQTYLPYRLEGFDRAGRPIVEVLFGKWQIQKYISEGRTDELKIQYSRSLEETIEKIRITAESTGRDIDQFYCIGNFNGFTTREQLCLGCMSVTLDLAKSYDALAGVFVRNTTLLYVPSIWQPILSTVKGFISLDSLNSLNVYDDDNSVWTEALLRDISPDQLPLRLGGTNTIFK